MLHKREGPTPIFLITCFTTALAQKMIHFTKSTDNQSRGFLFVKGSKRNQSTRRRKCRASPSLKRKVQQRTYSISCHFHFLLHANHWESLNFTGPALTTFRNSLPLQHLVEICQQMQSFLGCGWKRKGTAGRNTFNFFNIKLKKTSKIYKLKPI